MGDYSYIEEYSGDVSTMSVTLPGSTFAGNDSANLTSGGTDIPYMYVFSKDFVFVSLGVIIPFGLICNTISLVVFMSAKLRNRAASWYLAALAVSDDISLLSLMFDYWLKSPRVGMAVIKSSHTLCVTVTHLSYASRLFSAWLVTSLTIERFIGVVFPLRRAALSTTSHARRVVMVEGFSCLLATSFTLFTIGIVDETYGIECDVLPDRKPAYLVCNIIFLVFGSIVVPILVICTLNMFILQKIYQRKRHFVPKNMQFRMQGDGLVGGARPAREYNIATILLVVSTSFVALNIPYCVCWFVLFFRYDGSAASTQWDLFAAKYITSVPYYLNYAINFALYALCARAFRLELVKVLTCVPCRLGFRCRKSAMAESRATSLGENAALCARRDMAMVRTHNNNSSTKKLVISVTQKPGQWVSTTAPEEQEIKIEP